MRPDRLLRVLVTFDCARPSEDALLQLTALLEFDRLEVTGLYVEDEDLLRAASLPGLREISLTGVESRLDAEHVHGELARDAAAARAAFATLTHRLIGHHQRLTQRFDVIRGRVADALALAAADADLVLVTRTLRRSGLRPRQARAFAALARRPATVLFVNEPWASGTSVVVIATTDDGVRQGARLAAAEGLRLVAAAPADAALPELPPGAALRRLPGLTEKDIADLCLAEDARLLVLPADHRLDVAELLVTLADRLPCSVLKLA